MGRSTWLSIALLAVACGACNQRGPNRPATFAETTSAGEMEEDDLLGAVRLMDPGQEPRRRLRRTTPLGVSERVHLELVVGMGLLVGDETRAIELPPTVLELTAGPTARDPLDDRLLRYPLEVARVAMQLDSVEGSAESADMQASFQSLTGAQVDIVVDKRGRARPTAVSVDPNASASMLVFLQNVRTSLLGVTFPEQPVGVGARWRVRRRIESISSDPVAVYQSYLYRLTELNGDEGVLDVAMHTSGEPTDVPGDQPGLRVRYLASESMGLGSIRFRLERVLYDAELDGTSMTRSVYVWEGGSRRVDERMRFVLNAYSVD